MLIDVLHHTEDPVALLRECARVAPVIIVKDHLARNAMQRRTLAFMDWVGNRPHSVVLSYSYFSPMGWRDAVSAAGVHEVSQGRLDGLYPPPFSLLFGGVLHFVSRLERQQGSKSTLVI